jgi:hypothetical protein
MIRFLHLFLSIVDFSFRFLIVYHLIVDSDQVDEAIKPNWVIIIADYLYKFEEIIDPEINAFACFYKLMKSF